MVSTDELTNSEHPRLEVTMDLPDDLVKEPIFLVGSERSGTTLTRLMLDHHPKLAFFFEFEFSILAMTDDDGWPDLEEYISYIESDRVFLHGRLDIDRDLDYPHLVDSFLVQKRDRDGKPLVGATVHYHFDRLLRIWPDARFIHLVRDGRDVARSIIEMGWAGNMYTAVEHWIHAETLWEEMCASLPEGRRFELRYETLVREPEKTMGGVCDWLGIPYDRAMLSYTDDSTYGAPSTTSIGQWKRKLEPPQVALAECRIGDLLEERGYELSGYPWPRLSEGQLRRLRIQDRLYRANVRRKRYGWFLQVADLLARRARIRPMRRWTEQKIREIDNKLIR
jgi:hypothetical protein